MDALTLLREAREAKLGLTVSPEGRLVVRGPKSANKVAEALLDRKAEVISILELVRALTGSTPRPEPGSTGPEPERGGATHKPQWPPRSPVLAGWPDSRRERWGRRVTQLQDEGLGLWDAVRLAFEEIRAEQGSGEAEQGSGEPATAALDPHSATAEKPAPLPVRWECLNPFCLNKAGWWLSAHGAVNCLNCRPPSLPGLVVAQGGPEDAPMVDVERSNQAVRA
jgi:hypothetical protein